MHWFLSCVFLFLLASNVVSKLVIWLYRLLLKLCKQTLLHYEIPTRTSLKSKWKMNLNKDQSKTSVVFVYNQHVQNFSNDSWNAKTTQRNILLLHFDLQSKNWKTPRNYGKRAKADKFDENFTNNHLWLFCFKSLTTQKALSRLTAMVSYKFSSSS